VSEFFFSWNCKNLEHWSVLYPIIIFRTASYFVEGFDSENAFFQIQIVECFFFLQHPPQFPVFLENNTINTKTQRFIENFLMNSEAPDNPIIFIHTTFTFGDPKFDSKHYFANLMENAKLQVVELTPFCKTAMQKVALKICKDNKTFYNRRFLDSLIHNSNGNLSKLISMLEMVIKTRCKKMMNEFNVKSNVKFTFIQ